jgi:hypothetical protein
MADNPSVVLELPPYLYEFLSQFAEQSQQPIGRLLLDSIEQTYLGRDAGDIEQFFDHLAAATDAQLWWVLHHTFLWLRRLQLEELLERAEPLNAAEQAYVDTMLDKYNRYVLARSEALLLLKQRGHDIDAYLAAVQQLFKAERNV